MTLAARPGALIGSLGALTLAVAALALTVGAMQVPLAAIARAPAAWWQGALDGPELLVLWNIRLPRVLLGLVVGASLGVSGALLQALFRNPLAGPSLIGVSAGASFGAGVGILMFGASPWALPLTAFAGAVAATRAVFRLGSWNGESDTASLLLAGIAINAIAGAGTGLMLHLADEAQLRSLTFFSLGSLGGARWTQLAIVAPLALLPVFAAPRLARPLDALLLGEAEAAHLGVRVEGLKRLILVLVCVGVGACVASTGVIAFVGLAVPHLVRLVAGPDHAVVLPGSALLGAALLVGADALARVIVAPAELPIGILTTLLGGPFFLALLMRAAR